MVRKKILVICLVGLFFATAIGTMSVNAQIVDPTEPDPRDPKPNIYILTIDRNRKVGNEITFKLTLTDPADYNGQFRWNFGDGTGDEFTDGVFNTHVYNEANSYTVNVYYPEGDCGNSNLHINTNIDIAEDEGIDPEQYYNSDSLEGQPEVPIVDEFESDFEEDSIVNVYLIDGEPDSLTTDESSVNMV